MSLRSWIKERIKTHKQNSQDERNIYKQGKRNKETKRRKGVMKEGNKKERKKKAEDIKENERN